MQRDDQIMLLYTITDRGKTSQLLLEELKERQIFNHFRMVGMGTATSEMLDILGIGTADKDIFLSLAPRKVVESFFREVASSLGHIGRGRGISVLIPITAIGNLVASMILRQLQEETAMKENKNPIGALVEAGSAALNADVLEKKREAEKEREMESAEQPEYERSLIIALVNIGYTDDVMRVARGAGATGGTVIRGRLAGAEELARSFGFAGETEKEMVTILASRESRDGIMEALSGSFGFRTAAEGIILSLPVEKVFKI